MALGMSCDEDMEQRLNAPSYVLRYKDEYQSKAGKSQNTAKEPLEVVLHCSYSSYRLCFFKALQ